MFCLIVFHLIVTPTSTENADALKIVVYYPSQNVILIIALEKFTVFSFFFFFGGGV
jgi:hypothetical protein